MSFDPLYIARSAYVDDEHVTHCFRLSLAEAPGVHGRVSSRLTLARSGPGRKRLTVILTDATGSRDVVLD